MQRTFLATAVIALLSNFSANAAILGYYAELGPEAPGATGSGNAFFQVDTSASTMFVVANWSGLSQITTVAHIHCCTALPGAGTITVAVSPGTLPGFPAGVTSGSYSATIDLLNPAAYTAVFISSFGGGSTAGALAALLAGFNSDKAYFNIHTTAYPGGEIRGFIQPVPEPSALALAGLGLGSLVAFAARRRQR